MPHRRHLVLINTIANTFGVLTGPVLSLLLVPFYIKYLGLESYGLVGFFTALQLVLAVFSQGISMALQREVARRMADPVASATLPRLIRTFELVYFGIGGLAALGMVSASRYLSHHWIQLIDLDPSLVQTALLFISIRIAATFPSGLYQAVYIGTQRQVLGNLVHVAGATLLAAALIGAVLVWRNIAALYCAEMIVGLVVLIAQRVVAYRILPAGTPGARFALAELADQWKLSAGLIWTSGAGVVITQMDRILIGKWFPATSLAIYNAGTAGGRLVGMVYSPFLTAVYPETCRLASTDHRGELTRHIMRNAGIVAAVCMSFGLFICFFARDVLWVWTYNEVIAREGPWVMVLYVLGNIAQSYASVFYLLQTAKGSVRYPAWFNAAALFWYPLALMALTGRWGIAGAAACWLLYCSTTLIVLSAASFYHLLERSTAWRYIRMVVWTTAFSTGAMWLTRVGVTHAGIDQPWQRLLAGLSACVVLFVLLVIGILGWQKTCAETASIYQRLVKRIRRSTNVIAEA
jgi:O-antigen/teichoic acid export membrane protein